MNVDINKNELNRYLYIIKEKYGGEIPISEIPNTNGPCNICIVHWVRNIFKHYERKLSHLNSSSGYSYSACAVTAYNIFRLLNIGSKEDFERKYLRFNAGLECGIITRDILKFITTKRSERKNIKI